jgi:thiamine biosynthesis lipoprotein
MAISASSFSVARHAMRSMGKVSSAAIGVLSLGCFLGVASFIRQQQLFTFHDENVLGTSLELKVRARSEMSALKAESAVLAEIQREAKILSSYDSSSEFSRWFSTQGVAIPVSPELFETLSLFDEWRDRTNGALDASAEAVCRVWKSAAAENRLPTEEELSAAVAAVRKPHWSLNRKERTATHLSDTPLVLNTFVKSYIIDRAANAALSAADVSGVVVNIGGDIVIRGDISEPVQIADPKSDAENGKPIAKLLLRDRAVATSGNYRRGVNIQGRHYSHIVDPRTGRPADAIVSATVISPTPVDAGAFATALAVMDPEEGRRMASHAEGVEFLLIAHDGRRIESAGWRKSAAVMDVAAAAVAVPIPAAPQPGLWDPASELLITVELAHFNSPVRRPYVAIWIDNKDHEEVRTVALWQQKPKYLPDLRNWYREDRLGSKAGGEGLVASVTSATRAPGKYTVKWDGKDNRGKPVKAGAYFVNIEAAREHGTYQMMRQEMDFDGTPKSVTLAGGTEIASATLEYRKIQ